MKLVRPTSQPWLDAATWWPSLTAATAHLDPPLGVIALDALADNAFALLDRAAGMPIRVATKSIRTQAVIDAVLALPGYQGLLAFTLPEALWLASLGYDDIVVAYPSVDRSAIAALGADADAAARVTVMIDDVAHLDLIDAVAAPGQRAVIRVALDLDASLRLPALGHLGVRRSPLHTAAELRAMAEAVVRRPGFALVGVMSYEAQIAGLGNETRAIRAMQAVSGRELRARRREAIRMVREVAELEFVNGGGTGSLEYTSGDLSVTEIGAGSGLLGPHLFDHYHHFSPAPAAAFALPVVRRPTADIATLLGGGWIASGPPGADRLPLPVWPERLTFLAREGAGEVQSPVQGEAAADLAVGDRVWLRHTKAGELAEHVSSFHVVAGGAVIDEVATYRGEGKVFV
jgi:D-serine deaminase-like pyridoxal phosphate-dependent protein